MFAQPIVDAATGQVVDVLILVRTGWPGPDGELISPDRFLLEAIRFGMMPTIDRFMVTQAIELARAGRNVAVNLQRIRSTIRPRSPRLSTNSATPASSRAAFPLRSPSSDESAAWHRQRRLNSLQRHRRVRWDVHWPSTISERDSAHLPSFEAWRCTS